MTVSELFELEDCNKCPFMIDSICPGGWKSGAGGEPIEPPCTSWSDEDSDTDVDDLLHEYYAAELAWQRYLDDLEAIRQAKAEKNARRKETRKAMESYCYSERLAIKSIKKQIKACENIVSFARSMASAFNITNEMFRYEERYQVKPEYQQKLDELNDQLKKAEEAYKNKRKEFYDKRKKEQKQKQQ